PGAPSRGLDPPAPCPLPARPAPRSGLIPTGDAPMSDLDRVLDRIDADLDGAIRRLFTTLRLKSISTDPAYAAETRACAEWHAADLSAIGFDAAVRETPGHPMVVGHHGSSSPSVLFYGHYDVQPVDPLELWYDDPFEPALVTRPDGSREIRG